jgi:hypothetical protein
VSAHRKVKVLHSVPLVGPSLRCLDGCRVEMCVRMMIIISAISRPDKLSVCLQDIVTKLFWHFVHVVDFAMSLCVKCPINWSLKPISWSNGFLEK